MSKDPLLKQLVDDQSWHFWMDDRRSLWAYPVVSDHRKFSSPHLPLSCHPLSLRLADGSDLACFGDYRGETASMPCIASTTMISIPRGRPRFHAISRLGKPSGPRTNFLSCTPTVIPCTCFLRLVSPNSLLFVGEHELIVSLLISVLSDYWKPSILQSCSLDSSCSPVVRHGYINHTQLPSLGRPRTPIS